MTLKNDKNTFFKCHDAVTVSSACERLRHGGLLSSLLIRLRSSVFMTQTFVPAYSRIIRGFLVFVRTPVSPPIRWHRVSHLGP